MNATSPPSNIVVTDTDGKEITSLSIVRYTYIQRITLSCSESDVKWSIDPSLPFSLTLNRNTGVINGQVVSLLPETTFNITATNSNGSVSILFPITVTSCPYGEFLYPKTTLGDQGLFKLKKGKEEVYTAYLSPTGIVNAICIPYDTYSYAFNCMAATYDACIVTVVNESGLIFKSLQVTKKVTQTGQFEMIPQSVPTPYTPENPVLVVSETTVSIFISTFTIHGNFTFTPSLPSTVTFNYDRSSLQGVFPESGSYQYTVKCSNSIGEGSFVLRVNVDLCDSPLLLTQLSRVQGQASESMNITNSKGEVVFEYQFSGNSMKVNLCLPQDEYMVHTYTTSKTGWYEYAGLVIHDASHEIIGMYWMQDGEYEKHTRLILRYTVEEGSSIKYHHGFVSEKWTEANYRDSSWSTGSVGNWGSFDSDVYFRKLVELGEDVRFGVVLVNVFVEGTVELYVNTVLVWKATVLKAGWKRLSLQASLFEATSIVAVKLTKSNPSQTTIMFDLQVQPLFANSLMRSEQGTATDDLVTLDPTHSASKAFDGDPTTYWESSALPSSLTFTFAKSREIAVNEIRFYRMANIKEIPTFLQIEGVVDNTTSTVLATLSTLTFFKGNGFHSFYFTNLSPYPAYRIVFKASESTHIRMYEIRLYIRNSLTCKKQFRLSALQTGEVAYQSCPLGQVGVKQMRCIDQENRAVWIDDRSSCLRKYPSPGVAYVDTAFTLTNITMSEWGSPIQRDFATIITTQLTVKNNETAYTFVRDLTDDVVCSMEFRVRFTLEEDIGDYVQRHMKYLIIDLDRMLKEKYKSTHPYIGITADSGPDLYEPIPWGTYIRNTVIGGILLVIIVVLYLRSKPKGKGRKLYRKYNDTNSEISNLLVSD